jgi:D-alanine-D-alanine ligase
MKEMTEKEKKRNPHGADQMNATVKAVKSALEFNGHKVTPIPASIHMLSEIKAIGDIDVIFNASTGINHKREQANVVAMLELLNIPFVGSPLSSQIIGLHKSLAKRVFRNVGVPITEFQVFYTGEEALNKSLKFPLIVKPEHEGSSLGITNESVVFNEDDLYNRVKYTIEEFNQPALVEEFVSGREFTIGVMGTTDPQVLPIIEIIYDRADGKGIQTVEIKAENQAGQVCPADLSETKTEQLKDYALRAYNALGCSEFARIDVRMDEDENPYFIEINTLPGMQPDYSDFPIAAKAAGYDYNELVEELLQQAIKGVKKKANDLGS